MKLIGHDQKTYHFQHPDGRIIKVAKDAVSPEMIRNYAFGDEVSSDPMSEESLRQKAFDLIGYRPFSDTGRVPEVPMETLDALTGAPVRSMLDQWTQGHFLEGFKAGLQQIGKDPRTAPTGVDIATNLGIKNPYLGAAVATGIDVGAQLPIAEMARAGEALPGVIAGIKKVAPKAEQKAAENVIEAAERFKARAQEPLTFEQKLALYNKNPNDPNVQDIVPELLERAKTDAERARKGLEPEYQYSAVDRINREAEQRAYEAEQAARESARMSEEMRGESRAPQVQEKEPIDRKGFQVVGEPGFKPQATLDDRGKEVSDNFISHFAKKRQSGAKELIWDMSPDEKETLTGILNRYSVSFVTKNKILDGLLDIKRSDKFNNLPYAFHGQGIEANAPVPNYSAKPTGQIGNPGINVHYSSGNNLDPFMWVDSKYESAKNLMRKHTAVDIPAEINTSSDLIAREDYLNAIPPNSTINIHLLSDDDQLNRLIFPANPSNKRLLEAAETMKTSPILSRKNVKINVITPTIDDVIKAAEESKINFEKTLGTTDLRKYISDATKETEEIKNIQLPKLEYITPQNARNEMLDLRRSSPDDLIEDINEYKRQLTTKTDPEDIKYLNDKIKIYTRFLAHKSKLKGMAQGGEVKGLNMDNFKLLKEDTDSFHFQHPSGKTFKVAKKGLSKSVHKKIQNLYCGGAVKMAEGGEVDEVPPALAPLPVPPPMPNLPTFNVNQAAPQSLVPSTPSMKFPGADYGSFLTKPLGEALSQTMPMAFGATDLSSTTSNVPMRGPAAEATTDDLMMKLPGYQGTSEAYKAMGEAKQMEADLTAKAYENFMKGQQKAYEDHQQRMTAIMNEQQNLMEDYKNAKINPKRIFANPTTGQKVMGGIALILGSLGEQQGGISNIIEKAIDRDIELQQKDVDKKYSLYSMNLNKYNMANAAYAETKLQMNSMLQAQVAQVAAQSGSKQAKANADLLISELKMKAIPLMQQLAMWQIQGKSLGVGPQQTGRGGAAGEAGIPEGEEPQALLMDEKYRQLRVPIGNKVYQAVDVPSAEIARSVETLYTPILHQAKRLQELSNDLKSRIPGTPEYLQAKTIMGNLSVQLPMISGALINVKRISEIELEKQTNRFQDPTKFLQIMGEIKNDEFFRSMAEDRDQMLKQRVIGYKGPTSIESFKPISSKTMVPVNAKD